MNIFRLENLGVDYGALQFDGDLLRDALGRRALSKLTSMTASVVDKWPDCEGWFDSLYDDVEIEQYPDIYLWLGSILVLSDGAKQVLGQRLLPLGQFLPFTTNAGQYHLFITHSVVA